MYVKIIIYLLSILCLYCAGVTFCTPFENVPKISSENYFQLYKVILIFSSKNITFKSNYQWRLLNGIPKILVEETVIVPKSNKSEQEKKSSEINEFYDDGFCDLEYQSCLDLPGLEYERHGGVFKIVFNYTNGNVTFFSKRLWKPTVTSELLKMSVRSYRIFLNSYLQE
jgi:hypothetical protein